MHVNLNGEARACEIGTTITAFVLELGLDERGLAVERNRAIVVKSLWPTTLLVDGDVIEIVQFVGGGV